MAFPCPEGDAFTYTIDFSLLTRTHEFSRSGFAHVRAEHYIDSCSANETALDVALLQLDDRVPISLIEPKRVPKPNEQRCRDLTGPFAFNAVAVGYGGTNLYSGALENPYRNFRSTNGWVLLEELDGDRYNNDWTIVLPDFGQPFWYLGPVEGDSGGALLRTPGDVLCGVISRYGVPGFLTIGADAAAVDSDETLAFLHAHILDADGNFKDCPPDPPPQEEWVKIAYTPYLLPLSQSGSLEDTLPGTTPKADVGLRNCLCTVPGGTALECHNAGQYPINYLEYPNIFGSWKIMDVRAAGGPLVPPPPPPVNFAPDAKLVTLDMVDPVPVSTSHATPPGFQPPGTITQWADWSLGIVTVPTRRVVWSYDVMVSGLQAGATYADLASHYEAGVLYPLGDPRS